MKWFIITTMVVCLFLAACGGSDDSTTSKAADQPAGESQPQSVSNSSTGGDGVDPDQANAATGGDLNCPQYSYNGYETKEEAAMAAACSGADFFGLSIEYSQLVSEKDSERNATFRIVGFVEVCNDQCPQEKQTTVDVFINSAKNWESDNPYPSFVESQESKQTRADQRAADVNAITAEIADANPVLDMYGGFDVPFQMSSDDHSLTLQLQGDLADGSTGVIFQANRYNPAPRFDSDLRFGTYEAGDQVTIKSYRIIANDNFNGPTVGDWKPVN